MRIVRMGAAAGVLALAIPMVSSHAAVNRSVSIRSNYFFPAKIFIHTGDSVTWVNDSRAPHTVTSNSGSSESFGSGESCGLLTGYSDCARPGSTFAHTFDRPGVYDYHCRIHGDDAPYPNCRMCGEIVVRKRTTPATPPSGGSISPAPTGSGSVSVSPSPSASNTVSPGSTSGTPDSSPVANGPSGSSNSNTIAIAAVGIGLLGGTAIIVYRTMIRR